MTNEDGYPLERNPVETDRLAVQNRTFNRAVGYLLHPSIQRNLPAEPSIAELATGTGAFLADLAETLPASTRFDGYDISSVSFLPKHDLPENVNLNTADVRLPPPEERKGKYDVVCIRFINVALMPDDWQAVAQHAWALLKPGGALQWIEGNLPQLPTTPLRSAPETKTAGIEKAAQLIVGEFKHWSWFTSNLRGVLETVGFRNVQQMVSSSDRLPEDRKLMSWVVVGAFYSILCGLVQKGALTEQEAETARQEMLDDIEGGAYLRTDMHQFVAWKPADA